MITVLDSYSFHDDILSFTNITFLRFLSQNLNRHLTFESLTDTSRLYKSFTRMNSLALVYLWNKSSMKSCSLAFHVSSVESASRNHMSTIKMHVSSRSIETKLKSRLE